PSPCAARGLSTIYPSRRTRGRYAARECRCSRVLLGGTPARPRTMRAHRKRGNAAVDLELLRVRFAARRHDRIFGQWITARLQPFLQACFRILAECRGVRCTKQVGVDAIDDCARGGKTAVDKHRAE